MIWKKNTYFEFKNKNLNFWGLFSLFLSVAFLLGISLSRKNFFYANFENFDSYELSLLLWTFILALFSYGLLFFKTEEDLSRKEYLVIISMLIVAFATPPFLSRDIGAYLLGAKNLVWFHLNPYLSNLDVVPGNLWVKELGPVWWLKHTYVYGPVFLAITVIAILPNFLHLIAAVYFFKALVFLAYIVSVIIFSKIIKKLFLNKYLVFLYAINPAILINGLVDGHNEIFIICMLLFSIYFFLERKEKKSYFFWLNAVFIKYNMLIFLPIFWKKNSTISLKKIIISSLIVCFVMVAVFYCIGFDVKMVMDNFFATKSFLQECLYRCSPIISITDLLTGGSGGLLRAVVFLVAYVYVLFVFIIKNNYPLKFIFWTYLILIFVLVRLLTPWYVLPLIPVGLMVGDKKYQFAVFLLTAYSLLNFFGLF